MRLSVFTCSLEPPSSSFYCVFTGSVRAPACLLTLAAEGFTVCPNSNWPLLLIKGSCADPNVFSQSDILRLWLYQHDTFVTWSGTLCFHNVLASMCHVSWTANLSRQLGNKRGRAHGCGAAKWIVKILPKVEINSGW